MAEGWEAKKATARLIADLRECWSTGLEDEVIEDVLADAWLAGHTAGLERAAVIAREQSACLRAEKVEDALAELAFGITHFPHDGESPCVRCERDAARAEIDTLGREKEAIYRAWQEAQAERDAWKNAVIDAAVVNWTCNPAHTPHEAVNALLAWESQVALDPAVSGPAAALHAKIAALDAEVARLRNVVGEHRQVVVGLLSLEGMARDAGLEADEVLPKIVEALKEWVPEIDAALAPPPEGEKQTP